MHGGAANENLAIPQAWTIAQHGRAEVSCGGAEPNGYVSARPPGTWAPAVPGHPAQPHSAARVPAQEHVDRVLAAHVIWGEVERVEQNSDGSGDQSLNSQDGKKGSRMYKLQNKKLQPRSGTAQPEDSNSDAQSSAGQSGSRHEVEQASQSSDIARNTKRGLAEVQPSGDEHQHQGMEDLTDAHVVFYSSSMGTITSDAGSTGTNPRGQATFSNELPSEARPWQEEQLAGFLDQDGSEMSLGSQNHGFGQCRPCMFFHTQVGCQNGVKCEFCHFPHRRKDKPRPCKGKRDRYRKLVGRLKEDMNDGHDADEDAFAITAAAPAGWAGLPLRPQPGGGASGGGASGSGSGAIGGATASAAPGQSARRAPPNAGGGGGSSIGGGGHGTARPEPAAALETNATAADVWASPNIVGL